jgi:hypothetical protein
MKKNQSFYRLRAKSGQFYARAQYLKNQRASRFAFFIFLAFAIISAFFEAIASLLIK